MAEPYLKKLVLVEKNIPYLYLIFYINQNLLIQSRLNFALTTYNTPH